MKILHLFPAGILSTLVLLSGSLLTSSGVAVPLQALSPVSESELKDLLDEIDASLHRLIRRAYIGYLGLRSEDLLPDQVPFRDASSLFSDLNRLIRDEVKPLLRQGAALEQCYRRQSGDSGYADRFAFRRHRVEGLMHSNAEQYAAAAASLREAATLAQRIGDPSAGAHVLNNLAYCNFQLREHETAEENLQRAIEIARTRSDAEALNLFLYNLGWMRLHGAQPEAAIPLFEQVIELSQMHSNPIRQAAALNNLGSIDLRQGRWRQAGQHFSGALEISRRINSLRFRAISALNAALGLAREDDLQGAADHLTEALEILVEGGATAFMDAERTVLRRRALQLLHLVHSRSRQTIASPYLELPPETLPGGEAPPLHSHFAHLLPSPGPAPHSGRPDRLSFGVPNLPVLQGTLFRVPVYLSFQESRGPLPLALQLSYAGRMARLKAVHPGAGQPFLANWEPVAPGSSEPSTEEVIRIRLEWTLEKGPGERAERPVLELEFEALEDIPEQSFSLAGEPVSMARPSP